MLRQNEKWLNKQRRDQQIERTQGGDETAYFGFQRIRAAEKTDKVLHHFNTVARRYDFMNTLLSFGIHHVWKRISVRMMELVPGDAILDVCGGTGDLAILAARKIGPTGSVIVYDINRAMIQAGLHKVTHTELEKSIQYIQGDAENIAFPDNHFDATMVGFGIRNVTHVQRGFEEMYRILKPGGKLMCLEFSKPTLPVFRWLYDIYSFYIMPFLGELIAGSRKAYTHLPETIRTWPLPDELAEELKEIGFSRVTHRKLTNGIAVIHLAVK